MKNSLHMESEVASAEGNSVAINLLARRELPDTTQKWHKQSKQVHKNTVSTQMGT